MVNNNRDVLLPEAEKALNKFKNEIADEIGLLNRVHSKGWESISGRECGLVGGTMVRKMVRREEEALVRRR